MIKKKKNILFIIIGAVLIIAAIIAIVVFVTGSSRQKRLKDCLEQADRYLLDMDFENAILKYKDALNIDPSTEAAYVGIANSYDGWGEYLYSNGDMNAAIDKLNYGIDDLKQLNADSELIRKLELRIEYILEDYKKKEGESSEGVIEEEEEPVEEPEKEYIIEGIDLSSYENYGLACGGVIPVLKGEKWGAVNYKGEVIVSCTYDHFKAPNNAGYFVLYNDDEYVLYDKNGKEIKKTDGKIVASSDGYVVSSMAGEKVRWDYYDYDGNMFASLESGTFDDGAYAYVLSYPLGFYEGKSMFTDAGEVYNDRQYGHPSISFRYALVGSDGSVEWIDGNDVDESDRSLYMTGDEYMEWERKRYEEARASGGVYGSAGASCSDPDIANNSMNNGYFVTGIPRQWGYYLRDKDGIVAELNYYGLDISGEELKYKSYSEVNYGREGMSYVGTGDGMDGSVTSYYYDGDYYYNYGSKLVYSSNDKYALLDLAGGELEYKIFDHCALSNEKNWLVSTEGKWGYCDHDGNVIALYDDASAFNNGYALIRDGGKVYLIDEDLNRIEEICSSDTAGVAGYGELFAIWEGENVKYYIIERNEQ